MLLRNSTWLFLGRFFTQLLTFITSLLVAQKLGEISLGSYSTLTAWVYIGNVFTTFGLDTVLMRRIAQQPPLPKELINTAVGGQWLLALLFLTVLGFLFPTRPEFLLYGTALFPLALTTLATTFLRGREQMGVYSLLLLGSAIWQAGVSGVAGSLPQLLSGLWLGHWLTAGVGVYLLWGEGAAVWPSWSLGRELLRQGWWLMWLMVVSVTMQRLTLLYLSSYISEAEAGQFAAAFKLVEAGKLLPYAYYGALFPRLARSPTPFPYPKWLLLYCFTIIIGGELSAEWLVPLLFGPAFAPAASLLRLAVWHLLPFTLSLHSSFWLVASGRERQTAWVTTAGLFIAFVLHAFFIGLAHTAGAAGAFVAAEVCLAGLLWWMAFIRPGRFGLK